METAFYDRNPLRVEAVQVDEDNLYEVAKWCGGDVHTQPGSGSKFIKVDVLHPREPKHTRAIVSNWILKSDQGYKIYSDSAFRSGYTLVENQVGAALNQLQFVTPKE